MIDTATQGEAPAEAPAEAEAKPDYEALLTEAFVEASKNLTDEGLPAEQITKVQDAFRQVPSAARGRVQGLALKAVVAEGNLDAIEAILDACNDLPKAPSSARKPAVDPVEAASIQAAGLLVAYAAVLEGDAGEKAGPIAQDWYANGSVPADKLPQVLAAAERAMKAVSRGTGGSGTRRSFSETLEDLINDGRIVPGTTKLVGSGDAKATVEKSGKVRIGNDRFDNLSAAAKHAKGGDKAVNGWDFWSVEVEVDGEPKMVPVGTLRTK